MFQPRRTDADDPDFQNLVVLLDADLAARDGDEHAFYAPYNKTAPLKHVVVAYEDDIVVGCGAMKIYDEQTLEIKRMYVMTLHRNQGIAAKILATLEAWAREIGYKKCILETGKRQPEAIALYTKSGYARRPNFGRYEHADNSLCFEKQLPADA